MDELHLDDFVLMPELVQLLVLEYGGREFAVIDLCTMEELQEAFYKDARCGMRDLIKARCEARMQDAPPEE